jgi:predicted dehydrogenase
MTSPLKTWSRPRTGALGDAPILNWGILGPGRIAEHFTESVTTHTAQRIVAVGSRSAAKSAAFADRHGISASYGSPEELVSDPAVDIVYVSTPNSAHFEGAMLALRAGKHVLVEKSFAANAIQARHMVDEADRRGLFIMEAMWPRFLPYMDSVRQALDAGLIGEPISLTADLGDYDEFDAASRMYSPDLGGGITLDRGIYLVALSSALIGPAASVAVVGLQAPTGVDAHLSVTLGNGRSAHAQLLATMYARTPANAYLSGTEGSIEFSSPWYLSPTITLRASDGTVLDTLHSPLRRDVDALCFEAVEAARVVGSGGTSSASMPASESLAISETLDSILRLAHEGWTAQSEGDYLSTRVTSNE